VRTLVLLMFAIVSSTRAAAPSSAPATVSTSASTLPTTRPQDMVPLADGSIRYLPPPGWELLAKTDNHLKVSYRSTDGMTRIDITVTPQEHELPDNAAAQMAMIIGKGIREGAKKENQEFIIPPRVEKDPRFLLKIRDRARDKNESVIDRLQIYRAVGLNLVYVAVVTIADSPEHCELVAKETDVLGEDLLAGVRLTRGATPVVFGRSQLKITTPIDWKFTKFDQPNGPVVTYTDPKDASHEIIVRARIMPKDARTDPAKRDALITRMIDDERRQPPLSPSNAGDEQPASDSTSLRRTRVLARRENDKIVVDTRYVTVADILVSVRTVSAEGDEAVGKIADALTASIKPARE
jgi:hypothetical protein